MAAVWKGEIVVQKKKHTFKIRELSSWFRMPCVLGVPQIFQSAAVITVLPSSKRPSQEVYVVARQVAGFATPECVSLSWGLFNFEDSKVLEVFLSAAAAAAKSLQSCPTLSDLMDCSLPGSSVHGIFQARVLEWGAIAFSKEVFLSTFLQSPKTI